MSFLGRRRIFLQSRAQGPSLLFPPTHPWSHPHVHAKTRLWLKLGNYHRTCLVVLDSFWGTVTIIPAYPSLLGALSLPEDTPKFQSHGLCLWGRQGQGEQRIGFSLQIRRRKACIGLEDKSKRALDHRFVAKLKGGPVAMEPGAERLILARRCPT
ncbi:hypothetical protein ASPTUDRAFT_58117 [Aspergillus tubingensis CBS 134.48]|uniref:Uncharacterized protein n=1 Tax=Aspergillus tubingensis (strain CBS 134.48) TaxID=767770 RepID=A0A1L9MZI2_ASPTC|nr:hypothetical protein ASPTUDRAFT_58117 [Aspergillus tubingensis CBS 134.48]